MDHQSSRLDENPWDQCSQVDKGSKSYIGLLAHRSTRPDNNPGKYFGTQDQQDHNQFNSKFSSHGGLNTEDSLDSQASNQDCDNYLVSCSTFITFMKCKWRHISRMYSTHVYKLVQNVIKVFLPMPLHSPHQDNWDTVQWKGVFV